MKENENENVLCICKTKNKSCDAGIFDYGEQLDQSHEYDLM